MFHHVPTISYVDKKPQSACKSLLFKNKISVLFADHSDDLTNSISKIISFFP